METIQRMKDIVSYIERCENTRFDAAVDRVMDYTIVRKLDELKALVKGFSTDGGAGSGNFGHAGNPPFVGGSSGRTNAITAAYGCADLKPTTIVNDIPSLKGWDKKRSEYVEEKKSKGELWSDEDQVKAQETLQKVFDDNDFCIKTHTRDINSILEDGYKSQVELKELGYGHSGGKYNPDERKALSERMFGTPSDTPGNGYEKYGYLGKASDPREMTGDDVAIRTSQYGNVLIKLDKEALSDRTTYAMGDSIEHNFIPGGVDNHVSLEGTRYEKLDKYLDGTYSTLDGIRKSTYYVELQYHGEIKPSAIQSLTFKSKAEARNFVLDKLSPLARRSMKENSIKICYHEKKNGYQEKEIDDIV